ncbi:hypothetical protein BH11PLA1_BH11PLA1_22790 [soil metagenome]
MASDKDTKKNAPTGKPEGGKGPGAGGAKRPDKKPKNKTAAGGGLDDGDESTSGPRSEPRLQTRFKTDVAKALATTHGVTNPMQQPKLTKIVINVNMGRHLEGNKIPAHVKNTIIETVNKVTGQKPVVVIARKSVSNFKLREGTESSVMVTLRRDRMWHFLDRVINLAAPRIKDFRGLKATGFDKQGNYSFGLTEQGVFPEINMAEVQFTHGMNINVCFERSNPALSRVVLQELGMPFVKPEEKKQRMPSAPPAAAPALAGAPA